MQASRRRVPAQARCRMPLPALLSRSTVCAPPCSRPGVYREYMRDLCDRVSTAQSHNIHKLVRLLHG